MKILCYLSICLFLSASFVSAACDTDLPASTDHLAVYADGEIIDNETGLIWKKCLQGFSGTDCETAGTKTTFTWTEALGQAGNTWRLPNIKELQSIVEEGCASPAINSSMFPGTHTTGVWSNSPYLLFPALTNYSLYVEFQQAGDVTTVDLDSDPPPSHHVRLVRDAPAE